MRTRIECCKGCDKRQVGCHATCEDYIKQNEELDELRKKIKAEKSVYSGYVNYKQRSIQHNRKTIKDRVKGSGK